MSLAATAESEIVLMATVRSILGSRARNTAPIAPRPSSATISYRPNWCIVSIMHISPLGEPELGSGAGDGADNSTENQQLSQAETDRWCMSVGAKKWIYELPAGSLLSALF